MWISNVASVSFLIIYCLNTVISESATEARFSRDLSANRHGNRIQKSKHGHQLKEIDYRISCKEDQPLCLLQIQSKAPINKSKKVDRRCCKKRQKKCTRRTVKRCKSKTKCLVRNFRKCRKQFTRCGKRKIVNRRPGNCDSKSSHDKGRNQPHVTIPKITTTPKPKKKLKEKCHQTDECEAGLCCARHQHIKICQPLIKEGQVCKKDFRSLNKRSPEMYERCPCEDGLTCAPSMERHNTCQVVT